MPNSADAILIGFGIIIILYSLLNTNIKIKDSEIPKPSSKNIIFTRLFGSILLIIGILLHIYSIKSSDRVVDSNNEKIRLSKTNVEYLFKSKGFTELKSHLVTPEIISAFQDGYKSYQTRVCGASNNKRIVVPSHFERCPTSKEYETPHPGPTLDLTVFKK